jgi:hypothetical protein
LGVPIIEGVISWNIELLHTKQSTRMHTHTIWEAKMTAFKVLKFVIIPWSSTPKFVSTTNSYLLRRMVQQILHHLQHKNILYTKPPLPKFAPMRKITNTTYLPTHWPNLQKKKIPLPCSSSSSYHHLHLKLLGLCLLEHLSKPSHTTKNASNENIETSRCHRK